MQVLLNASLAKEVADAITKDHGWQLRRVASVAAAVKQLSHEERTRVEAVVVETEPIDEHLITELPNLRIIGCLRSEPVNVDVVAASAQGVIVVYTPGRNADAVAEYTLGLCLAMIRNIAIGHHGIVARVLTTSEAQPRTDRKDVIWRPVDKDAPFPSQVFRGRQLAYLVVAVVGYGAVGRAVARIFAGLAREVIVVDPYVDASAVAADGFCLRELDEALAIADVVTVHARGSTEIIGRRELAMMKPDAYLINTARATILDYDALVEALTSESLKGAALDVFPDEPLLDTSELLATPRLTLTPHLAGAANEVVDRQSEIFLDVVRGIASDEDWDNLPIKNRELRSRWQARSSH